MKALLHYGASPGFLRRLDALRPPWLSLIVVGEDDADAFRDEMRDADVLLHVLKPVSAENIAGAPQLKLIQKIGVGVNTIALDAARARGVAVCNMPGSNSQAVAEMTLMLMLAVLRNAPALDALTRAGRGWSAGREYVDGVGELAGRSVGLVGYGEVARRLAPVLAAIGARVLYTATRPKPDARAEWRSLPELLAESDVISLHIPLTPDTERLIDAGALARMRPGAVLVNTARGGLVDERALVSALQSGHLRAAGLDVFEDEPVDSANPLFQLPGVVVTPHVAWLTPETLERSVAVAFENCRRLKTGAELLHRVV